MEDLTKNITITVEETKMLREQFLSKYAKEQGWDANNLSSNQMLEIVTHKQYQNPGLILG